ncbi:dynein light chain Tctex-type 1 [Geospiza fortis]|uniref:Dynein light chain Tctex-type 1 n=7 Tax=Passeriformes TaxID=9126 RepID=A0A6I9HG36_GEOFO|nr:dynein light chain Tctex-type 1 [Geospiza fortis]
MAEDECQAIGWSRVSRNRRQTGPAFVLPPPGAGPCPGVHWAPPLWLLALLLQVLRGEDMRGVVASGWPRRRSRASFLVDEVSSIIKEAIEGAIGGNAYQHSKVNQWTTSVVEQTLSQLTKLGKPFKYIVTCVIMQKNGAGLHTASSCFWDNSSDGTCTVRWENKTMYCIVSAFGLAL